MTLQPQDAFSLPDETIRIARAAYPKGNVYIQMRDALGPIYHDEYVRSFVSSERSSSWSTLATSTDHSHARGSRSCQIEKRLTRFEGVSTGNTLFGWS